MSEWLDPLRQVLDVSPRQVTMFFRDDDVGWDDDSLFELLDLFASYSLPLDLAVIPEALTSDLARRLLARAEAMPNGIKFHQHGFSHLNHEPEGRKCEFGPDRSRALQRQDIALGKKRLADLLGTKVDPIFTPPWNRCTRVTGECLVGLEFSVLSRDSSAEALDIMGLFEMPISVDWFAKRKGVRLKRDELGARLAAAVRNTAPVGIMFHHALMDAHERCDAGELLDLLATHERARCSLMQAIASRMETS